jgi:hypothetical protein
MFWENILNPVADISCCGPSRGDSTLLRWRIAESTIPTLCVPIQVPVGHLPAGLHQRLQAGWEGRSRRPISLTLTNSGLQIPDKYLISAQAFVSRVKGCCDNSRWLEENNAAIMSHQMSGQSATVGTNPLEVVHLRTSHCKST